MPAPESFAYALLRVVPCLERGRAAQRQRFLAARVHLDEQRLRALHADCDPAAVRSTLDAIVAVAAGTGDGPTPPGPVGALRLDRRRRRRQSCSPPPSTPG